MFEDRQKWRLGFVRLTRMPMTIPSPLAPAVAWGLTTVRPSVTLVGRSGFPASTELEAFLRTLGATAPDAPTACDGWSAHELVAHLAAGSKEMAWLVNRRLELGPGADIGPTIPFEEREPPCRALADRVLRRMFVREGLALTDAILRLQKAGPGVTVTFTGSELTVDDMIRHGRSELVLHRWDLVGTDATSRRLLDDPELLEHGRHVLAEMGLPETALGPYAGQGLTTAEAILLLWGRDPAWRPGPA
jgi:hypothetical protein